MANAYRRHQKPAHSPAQRAPASRRVMNSCCQVHRGRFLPCVLKRIVGTDAYRYNTGGALGARHYNTVCRCSNGAIIKSSLRILFCSAPLRSVLLRSAQACVIPTRPSSFRSSSGLGMTYCIATSTRSLPPTSLGTVVCSTVHR